MSGNLIDSDDYLHYKIDEYISSQSRSAGISRQKFLQILASLSTFGAVTSFSKPAFAQTKINIPVKSRIIKEAPAGYISHSPGTLEMNWGEMYGRGYIVPNKLFYVHNRSQPPVFDPNIWRLQIEGTGVSKTIEFTYDDIINMPSVSVICAIECAANGRRFFEEAYNKPLPGVKWRLGAIGVAEWTGVPLNILLERAGILKSARDVFIQGADLNSLSSQNTHKSKFSTVVPIEKALADNSLLVYAMNGEQLPYDHGRPCRVIFPGWSGNAHVKWVERIVVSNEPIYTPWIGEQMVLIGSDYASSAPYKGTPVTYQNVKSAFELAWEATLTSGQHLLRGRSWSGKGKIASVEVSFDSGRTWKKANLREPNLPYAWTRWDISFDATPGEYLLQARATDSNGNIQPTSVPWNLGGLLYGAVVNHPIKVI